MGSGYWSGAQILDISRQGGRGGSNLKVLWGRHLWMVPNHVAYFLDHRTQD